MSRLAKQGQPQPPPLVGGAFEDDVVALEDFDMDKDVYEGGVGAAQQEKLMDADFFNQFPDDLDEGDMDLQ